MININKPVCVVLSFLLSTQVFIKYEQGYAVAPLGAYNKTKTKMNYNIEKKCETEFLKIQKKKKIKSIESSKSTNAIVEQKINYKTIKLIITFYTSLAGENSGHESLNAQGGRLYPGTIASNCLPFGTKITTEQYGLLTVEDRGSKNFNFINDHTYRVDMYISKQNGESNRQYQKRVYNMGKVEIDAKLLLN